MEDAVADGAVVAVLSSTCSSPGERLVDAALTKLGGDVTSSIRIFQCPQGNPYMRDPDSLADHEELSLEDMLRAETAKVPPSFTHIYSTLHMLLCIVTKEQINCMLIHEGKKLEAECTKEA